MNILACTLASVALLGGTALAQTPADGRAPASPSPASSSPATAAGIELADGVVRKVDKDTGKLTLKHGEIRHLDMPGMTMVFQVQQPTLLDKLAIGDKVRFRAEKAGGAYVVTAIEPAR